MKKHACVFSSPSFLLAPPSLPLGSPPPPPPPLAHFDVRKVEGNQSRFLLSGRCGLLLPGARLAVKTRQVWVVCAAPQRCQAQHRKATGPRRPPHRSEQTDRRMDGRCQRKALRASSFTSDLRGGGASVCWGCEPLHRPLQTWGKFPSERQRATF